MSLNGKRKPERPDQPEPDPKLFTKAERKAMGRRKVKSGRMR